MNIQCESWNADMAYLRERNNLITTAKIFTQALIHSNLFDAHQGKHGTYKVLTLSEMVAKHYKKPFVSAIIEGILVMLNLLLLVFFMYFLCISHVNLMYFSCI
jgi:hypothetical protein